MSLSRAVLLISVASVVAAVVVALAARVPAEIRADKAGADATDPSLGATFTDAQVERHGAYRRGAYVGFAASIVLEVVVLLILARGPLGRLLDATSGVRGGWVTQALLAALFVTVVGWLAQLPLAYVRGYEIQHAWGLSTQAASAWLLDRGRSLLVAGVVAAVAALTFFAMVRWQPRLWWVWGWIGFTLLTALLYFLYPVAIAPLFNRFTPLEDPALEASIRALADEAGVQVDQVLVADASKRSSVENAYVAGIGATKQVVLYDTLLGAGDTAETEYVVAHELGHEAEDHVLKNLVLSSAGLLLGFGALALLAGRSRLWEWAGATSIRDPVALPLLVLFATLAGLVLLPAQNGVSRSFERRADEIAIQLTRDPATAIKVHRRLAFANLSDLRPPAAAVWLLYSHPPVRDRIRAVAEIRPSP